MKLAYVAGPYRASTESGVVQNIRNAEAVAIELWKMGYAVICPHKNTALFGGLAPDEVWLKGDLVMMERCDVIVCTPDWRKSSGARDEVKRAIECDIPVYQWPDLSAPVGEYCIACHATDICDICRFRGPKE
jgi:hypothetical protein